MVAELRTVRDLQLPDWCERLRDHQVKAVQEVMDAFAGGAKVVVLDAPTGSGKTLIAEVVRQMLGVERTAYVCSSLTLQDQFARDFPQACVAKGRDNYGTDRPGHTAADCIGTGCGLCDGGLEACEYQQAKEKARTAPLACLNSTFWLYQANYGRMRHDFVVVDECDVLDDELTRFCEVKVGQKWIKRAEVGELKKGAHKQTVEAWLGKFQAAGAALAKRMPPGKEKRALEGLLRNVRRIRGSDWVREYDNRGSGVTVKPVWAKEWGNELVWKHGDRFLLMSGSVVSASELLYELGYDGPWAEVSVDMTFPEVNRIITMPHNAVDMSYKRRGVREGEVAKLIDGVLAYHPGQNVLVHTVSYKLGRELADWEYTHLGDREVHFYEGRGTRERALRRFKEHGGVLFAPSMDRGVDFPGDECHVVVVAKVPYPNLGDAVVKGRVNGDGRAGQLWYATRTVRSLLQMTGRHVRSKDDKGVTYVLDEAGQTLVRKNRSLFPRWWLTARRSGRI